MLVRKIFRILNNAKIGCRLIIMTIIEKIMMSTTLCISDSSNIVTGILPYNMMFKMFLLLFLLPILTEGLSHVEELGILLEAGT